mmetsp:Transcript_44093/g.125791  ORF Transcript_44093/g.125791 Transcript_44093/m.125791 type:complete len:265 (-) Transcript_44093:157-951(-)
MLGALPENLAAQPRMATCWPRWYIWFETRCTSRVATASSSSSLSMVSFMPFIAFSTQAFRVWAMGTSGNPVFFRLSSASLFTWKKKLLRVYEAPSARNLCDSMSARRTTQRPCLTGIWWPPETSSKGCISRVPGVGPMKKTTMKRCHWKTFSHFMQSLAENCVGGMSVACPPSIRYPGLRELISKPKNCQESGSRLAPRARTCASSLASEAGPSSETPGASPEACGPSSSTAMRTEPIGPRSPSTISSGGRSNMPTLLFCFTSA